MPISSSIKVCKESTTQSPQMHDECWCITCYSRCLSVCRYVCRLASPGSIDRVQLKRSINLVVSYCWCQCLMPVARQRSVSRSCIAVSDDVDWMSHWIGATGLIAPHMQQTTDDDAVICLIALPACRQAFCPIIYYESYAYSGEWTECVKSRPSRYLSPI